MLEELNRIVNLLKKRKKLLKDEIKLCYDKALVEKRLQNVRNELQSLDRAILYDDKI